ncbi:MAG: ATP-dependent helicase [Ignavibacteria bacterium]|nr:ATP-dependent helicase [Ignavibacteria bacterium]
MKLTEEQKAIISSAGNIKINAVAGSGKTTTIIEYAKTRPQNSRILYLAFNRSVRNEAVKKFAAKGLNNVKVETAHSLAFRQIVYKYNYKVRAHGFKSHDVIDILRLKSPGEQHGEYIAANHILKFLSYFCNSTVKKVSELNYKETVSDKEAMTFVMKHYGFIENQTRLLLAKMNNSEIEITHDFYLKKFQLSEPKLEFDYILFDEGQDASAVMLDVFMNQDAVKVIVGDTHQQIYGWRYAVNSLEKADFTTYGLTKSFRFGQDIADLAMSVLKRKDLLKSFTNTPISGEIAAIENDNSKVTAILGRTNLGLLIKAIETVTENSKYTRLYFEGNINSYTYADEGASLYDVLHLYNGKRKLIRDKLLKTMKSMSELHQYIEKTEDMQLSMLVEIVKKYGNDLPKIIRRIKAMHVNDDEKDTAEIIFSTIHRCKGMEYDDVRLVNDFMTEEKIKEKADELKSEGLSSSKLNEEINLLYVAVTRTRKKLSIPECLVPKGLKESPDIFIIKPDLKKSSSSNKDKFKDGKIPFEKPDFREFSDEKNSSIHNGKSFDRIRERHRSAYLPWSKKLDNELREMYSKGEAIETIAKKSGRTAGAIRSRIQKLELDENFG